MTLGSRGPRGSRLGAGRTEAPPEAEAKYSVFPTRKLGKYSLGLFGLARLRGRRQRPLSSPLCSLTVPLWSSLPPRGLTPSQANPLDPGSPARPATQFAQDQACVEITRAPFFGTEVTVQHLPAKPSGIMLRLFLFGKRRPLNKIEQDLKATDPSDLWKDGQQQPQLEKPKPVLDGAAARAFYEAVIADESSSPQPQRPGPIRERKRKKSRVRREAVVATAAGASGGGRPLEDEDKVTQCILLAAQNGDVTELRRLLEPREAGGAGGNVNAHDAFWWTPLMCAARAGQGAAVRYLLGRGAAWVGVCELGGRDAAQLAEEAGFPEVARMVRESHGETRSPENQSRSPRSSSQFCEDCGAHFEDSNHRTSTAHLLSLSRGPQPSNLPLGVPTSSPGFRLLLRGGWEPGMGLGPRGEGRANPIPTVLKRDQEGLGYGSAPQPRVTHFPARDTRAVSGRERVPRVATLSQRENRKREEKDRAWERDLRLYMNLEF